MPLQNARDIVSHCQQVCACSMLLLSALMSYTNVQACTFSKICIRGAHQFSHGVWNCSSCWAAQNFVDPPAALQRNPYPHRSVASGHRPETAFRRCQLLFLAKFDVPASRPPPKARANAVAHTIVRPSMQPRCRLSQPQTLHAAECLPHHPPEAPSALSWPWLAHAVRQHLCRESSWIRLW